MYGKEVKEALTHLRRIDKNMQFVVDTFRAGAKEDGVDLDGLVEAIKEERSNGEEEG